MVMGALVNFFLAFVSARPKRGVRYRCARHIERRGCTIPFAHAALGGCPCDAGDRKNKCQSLCVDGREQFCSHPNGTSAGTEKLS